jgi:hypothetical protein
VHNLVGINVLNECTAFGFYHEERGNMFLQNAGNDLQNSIASQPPRQQSIFYSEDETDMFIPNIANHLQE